LTRSRVELKEVVLHELINLHDGGLITTAVAIVGCGEDSDDVALVRPVVSVHDQLMGAGNPSEVVGVVELLRDILTKAVASTTR